MKRISPVVWLKVALLAALLLLPLRMGEGANDGVPVIGAAEQLAADYCDRTLERATAAYVSAKVVDKTISLIQRAEISVTPVGVGLTFAPGELLAAANEAIERVSARRAPFTLTITSPAARETTLTSDPSTKPSSARCWRRSASPRTRATRATSCGPTIASGNWAADVMSRLQKLRFTNSTRVI